MWHSEDDFTRCFKSEYTKNMEGVANEKVR